MSINIKGIAEYRDTIYRELLARLGEVEGGQISQQQRQIDIARIREINKDLKQIEKIYRQYATFQTEAFTDFMAKCLTLTEGGYVRTKFLSDTTSNTTHYVVSSKETREFLRDHIRTREDVERFFRADTPRDVTKFTEQTTYPFDKSLRIKTEYERHPRLKKAIYEVMSIKANHGEISEEKAFDIVLYRILQDNLKKSDDAYFQKRKRVQQS